MKPKIGIPCALAGLQYVIIYIILCDYIYVYYLYIHDDDGNWFYSAHYIYDVYTLVYYNDLFPGIE